MSDDAEKDHRDRVSFFRGFLYCGGAITLDEWRKLASSDRGAFVEAAAMVEAARAARIVEAIELRSGGVEVAETRGEVLERAAREAVTRG